MGQPGGGVNQETIDYEYHRNRDDLPRGDYLKDQIPYFFSKQALLPLFPFSLILGVWE
jgi:hypothetical protein